MHNMPARRTIRTDFHSPYDAAIRAETVVCWKEAVVRDDDRDAGRGTEISCSIYSDSAASLRSAGTRSPCCPLLVDDTTFSIISDDDKSSRSRTRKFSLPFDRSLRRADSEPDAASPLAAAVFAALPAAVYEGIVRQLEAVHASPRSDTCDTCFLRDLTSLARTSRAWDRASIKTLYTNISLPLGECQVTKREIKVKWGSFARMRKLLRTLRERPSYARVVRQLTVPDLKVSYQQKSWKDRQEFIDLLVSIVLACPNVERLLGFYPPYKHQFDHLLFALSTRQALREVVWVISSPEPGQRQQQQQQQKQLHGAITPDQSHFFLRMFDGWALLDTLVLHAQTDAIFDRSIFPGMFGRLPSLRHLLLSSLCADDFDNQTLQTLPPLASLRLQDLPGVTESGLLAWAHSAPAARVRSLTLLDMQIRTAAVVHELLRSLPALARFTFAQMFGPLPPPHSRDAFVYSSPSLRYLHWDFATPGTANRDLAGAIAANAFPLLERVRAPNDDGGWIQLVCRPAAQIALPADYWLAAAAAAAATSTTSTAAAAKSMPGASSLRLLPAARRAAQDRVEDKQLSTGFRFVVEDGGRVRKLQTVRAPPAQPTVDYWLEPDVDGSDFALMDIADLVNGQNLASTLAKEPCTGKWNSLRHGRGNTNSRRWFHPPRWRESSYNLQLMF